MEKTTYVEVLRGIHKGKKGYISRKYNDGKVKLLIYCGDKPVKLYLPEVAIRRL